MSYIVEISGRGHRALVWIGTLALLSACAESPAGLGGAGELPATKAIISAPVAARVASRAAITLPSTYVAMAPGTDPGGESVTISRLRGGASVGSLMTDGGFDPIGLEADAGDTLAISIHHESGDTSTTYGVVPVKGRPVIVRTSPTEGRTDVPLNCIIQVVFSEPMDSLSLVDALHLQLHGVNVTGSVSVTSTNGVILSGQFVPSRPLASATVYQVLVSSGVRSTDGEPLAAPISVRFTTQRLPGGPDTGGTGGPGTGTPFGSIQVHVHTDGAPVDADGYTIILDNASSGHVAPVNGDVLLTDVVPGDHRVRLEGVGGNCWLSGSTGGIGDVPGSGYLLPPVVSVTSNGTASLAFDLVCFEPGPDAIDVRVERSGDPFSYFWTLILTRSDGLTRPIQPGVVEGLSQGSYQVLLTGGVPFHLQCAVTPPDPITVDLGSDSPVSIVLQLFCSNN